MPPNNGLGTHDHERITPPAPRASQQNPEGAVRRAQPHAPTTTQSNRELMPQRRVLHEQRVPGAGRGQHAREQHQKKAKHCPEC